MGRVGTAPGIRQYNAFLGFASPRPLEPGTLNYHIEIIPQQPFQGHLLLVDHRCADFLIENLYIGVNVVQGMTYWPTPVTPWLADLEGIPHVRGEGVEARIAGWLIEEAQKAGASDSAAAAQLAAIADAILEGRWKDDRERRFEQRFLSGNAGISRMRISCDVPMRHVPPLQMPVCHPGQVVRIAVTNAGQTAQAFRAVLFGWHGNGPRR